MAHQLLVSLRVPISLNLRSVHNPPHLLLLLLGQLNISTAPVLFQSTRLSSSRDSDEALCSDPGQRHLCSLATFFLCELFDFLDDCAVLVEIVALKFGGWEEISGTGEGGGEGTYRCVGNRLWQSRRGF